MGFISNENGEVKIGNWEWRTDFRRSPIRQGPLTTTHFLLHLYYRLKLISLSYQYLVRSSRASALQ